MTKMRFGIQTSINDVAWSELADMWRFDRETSFYSAWTFDHFVPPARPRCSVALIDDGSILLSTVVV